MAKQVRIPVPEGLVTHRGICTEVRLSEPSYDDYIELGEIVTIAKAPDGTVFWFENSEILRSYIGKCLVEPKDPLILNQGGLELARAVKDAVLGFFRRAPSEGETSPTSPTTSSSNSKPDDSAQTLSAG